MGCTHIHITPVVMQSDDLRGISVEKRECLFSDEVAGLIFFKNYSQAACQFECLVRHAKSVCHCTPWDFPFQGNHTSICNLYGYYCFEESMKNTSHLNEECPCLPDCNVIDYHIEQTATPIDFIKECENKEVSFSTNLL